MDRRSINPQRRLATAALLALLSGACGGAAPDPAPTPPYFTDPVSKLALLASEPFAATVHGEAVSLQPLLATAGTQVHMGFWSRAVNRTRLVALLDEINAPPPGAPPRWAVWDEGVSTAPAGKIPAYATLELEYWYERAQAEVGGLDTVTLGGVTYVDPYPVTFEQADEIWGRYSSRFAETAAAYHRDTGNVVQVWALVYGADPTRIFFRYECPKLTTLRYWGHVQVQCARVAEPSWTNPADWCDCSVACAPCAP